MKIKTASLMQCETLLRKHIKAASINQISRRSKLSTGTVGRVARGEGNPSLRIIDRIAQAAGFGFRMIKTYQPSAVHSATARHTARPNNSRTGKKDQQPIARDGRQQPNRSARARSAD